MLDKNILALKETRQQTLMRTLTPTEMRRIERWARDTQIAAILVLSNEYHPPSAGPLISPSKISMLVQAHPAMSGTVR